MKGTLNPRALSVLIGAVLFLLLPLLWRGTSYAFLTRLLGVTGLYLILALGVNMVLGYVGLLDLGFMAFYAVGAYTTALLSLKGLSFWVCLPASAALAMGVRALLGWPVLRLKGDYLSIVTLGFGEIARIILNNWDSVTNGPKGISLFASTSVRPISFFGAAVSGNLPFFYLIYGLAGVAFLVSHRLHRSRIGRAWVAVRENEIAAQAMGVDVARMKLVAFALSGAFAGAAGAVFSRWEGFVTPESFTFWESVMLVAMVVLGGMGSLPGVAVGVALIVGIPEVLRSDFSRAVGGPHIVNLRYLIFGVLMILMAVFRPQGIWPRREGGMR
jgi:branched-chain amino acid transport system permease protein